jgi:hypothetical protein
VRKADDFTLYRSLTEASFYMDTEHVGCEMFTAVRVCIVVLGLNLEDDGNMSPRNVGIQPEDYTL